MFSIRKYEDKDLSAIIKLAEELQDYLVKIDPLHRLYRLPQYGVLYAEHILTTTKEENGKIFVAEIEDHIFGFIVGCIEKESELDKLGYKSIKTGRVTELIITQKLRGVSAGQALLETIEKYFKLESCDIIRIEVFVPNENALNFYDHLGYHPRVIDMVKEI